MIKRIGYLLLLFQLGCGTSDTSAVISSKKDSNLAVVDTTQQVATWIFDKIEKQKLIFKNAKVFDTHLFELKYIGQIPMANKAPYLIFSGRDCDECDANISIYVHSPDDGKFIVEMGQNRYQYPGSERDFANDSLLFQSQAFFGQVLNNTKGIIWYQKKLTDNNKWVNDIFLIDLSQGKKKESLLKDTGQIRQTLSLLKSQKCLQIKGIDFKSEP